MRRIDLIVLHCSATDYKNKSTGYTDQSIEWIRGIHLDRGFDDVGYHYFIRFSGLIEAGRPIENYGSHVKGKNRHSIGICLAGEIQFTEQQFTSLQLLLNLLQRQFPKAGLKGHRELDSSKTCPNFDYRGFLDRWYASI